MKINWLIFSIFIFIFLASTNVYAQTGTFKANDVLKSEPSEKSATSGSVSANSQFQILERKGFWAKVQSGSANGWTKMSSLNLDQNNSGAAASALGGLVSGRTGSGNIVSTSGTRGLSAEDLKASKPDMDAVKKVQGFTSSVASANDYANSGKLGLRKVEYLSDTNRSQSGGDTQPNKRD